MITREGIRSHQAQLNKKAKLERLALIKERYQRLIVRQRQQIEQELQDASFGETEEFGEE